VSSQSEQHQLHKTLHTYNGGELVESINLAFGIGRSGPTMRTQWNSNNWAKGIPLSRDTQYSNVLHKDNESKSLQFAPFLFPDESQLEG